MKQYWADAATKNCVWLFQVKEQRYGEEGCTCGAYTDEGEAVEGQECTCAVEFWRTENVFLTREEGDIHGNARPYAWGEKGEGWRIYGVMCIGLMAELLGKHEAIMNLRFGERLSINGLLEKQIDHTSKLIKSAQHLIRGLPEELKLKIVKEGIESLDKWSGMYDKRAKMVQLDKQIEKIRKNDGRKRNHKKKKAVRKKTR